MKKKLERFDLTTFPLAAKTIFLRTDLNVPFANKQIQNYTKIKASLPTIHFLLQKHCKIILATHLGRPDGKWESSLSTKILLPALKQFLPTTKITPLKDCIGKEIVDIIKHGKEQEIFLLENLRFYKEEEENDPAFAHSLASLADIYINDAFASSHRAHASLEKITHFLPSLAGAQLEREIHYLSKALNPQRPAVWLLGGAKLDKVELIQQALHRADYILLGGALPFAFLSAQKIPIGLSKVDCQSIATAAKISTQKTSRKIIKPIDFKVSTALSPRATTTVVKCNQIASNHIALDLGPETIKLYKQYLRKARTIIWNGPLGYYEWAPFAAATRELGRLIGTLTATSICGGGETINAIQRLHLTDKITHISTGGGATLEFLSGRKLPGINALERNYQRFHQKIQ